MSAHENVPSVPDGHRTAERRSLAMHQVVADRLTPEVVAQARENVERKDRTQGIDPSYTVRWRELLALPLPEIAAAITRDDEAARALRQTTPFAFAIPQAERDHILATVR